MSGRRLVPTEKARDHLAEIWSLFLRVNPPGYLAHKVFIACAQAAMMPPNVRDLNQAEKDITEAIGLTQSVTPDLDPVAAELFSIALQMVSAREHIVAMPGQSNNALPFQ